MNAQAIVVGAGPAGAATALLLAERGIDVVVLDRARFPRPKICGEYLSPEALRILDRLGVLKAVEAAGALPVTGMRVTAPDGTVVAGRYGPVGPWRPYQGHGLAVPRLTLDAVLAERLRALPVDFREENRVTDVLREGGQVVGVETVDRAGRRTTLRAPLVIAADGRTSVVAERLGCRRAHRLRRLALVTYVTGLEAMRDVGEVFVDPPDYAILNALGPDHANLSLVVPLADARRWAGRLETFFTARVKQLRHLSARLAGASRVGAVRAMGPLAYRVVPPRLGGVLLVGDAAGFYDPFTGEGMFTALRSAELLAETAAPALERGDTRAGALEGYERARREAFAAKARVSRAIQLLVRHRWLANAFARFLARRPATLDLLLGVVGDFVPPRELLPALLARR